MDRLARNLMNLQKMVGDLTSRGVIVEFHKEHLTFTSDTNPMSRLMLQIMGSVAEFERSLILERQREGISKAKQAGRPMGAQVVNESGGCGEGSVNGRGGALQG